MNSEPIISVRGLGKRYRLGETLSHDTLRDQIAHGARRLWHRLRPPTSDFRPLTSDFRSPPSDFWALKDVSFDVQRGEVLGIIGRNGAGKSTLLKILSQITEPTEGEVRMRGRVASLLEVGTGFHEELTGRENVYLNGAILGMRKAEIDKKFDEIVAFSGVERFLDTPVKRYSSGMYVRLAFAVAAHLEPELLLIDEILAVGDASFRQKCLGKMGEVARQGRTILFVSHNMAAIQTLCSRVLFLAEGRLQAAGAPDAMIAAYLHTQVVATSERFWPDPATAPGTGPVRLRRLRVVPDLDASPGVVTMQTPIRIEAEYWNAAPEHTFHLALQLQNELGSVVFTSDSASQPDCPQGPRGTGLYSSVCHVPGNLLNSGCHSVSVFVIEHGVRLAWRADALVSFDVQDTQPRQSGYLGRMPGAVHPHLRWESARVH